MVSDQTAQIHRFGDVSAAYQLLAVHNRSGLIDMLRYFVISYTPSKNTLIRSPALRRLVPYIVDKSEILERQPCQRRYPPSAEPWPYSRHSPAKSATCRIRTWPGCCRLPTAAAQTCCTRCTRSAT
ncbi:protein of unknown function (plasmid) [Cupriavidus taiwanensis]|uniref:Uncharacterized protein n=1 Tax=Cupriavidus taiwanensis TaxID=164546 RepID=A0A375IJQ6_9BURK|nr:protein of unknown function [Cupriavidus taiwanensis]